MLPPELIGAIPEEYKVYDRLLDKMMLEKPGEDVLAAGDASQLYGANYGK